MYLLLLLLLLLGQEITVFGRRQGELARCRLDAKLETHVRVVGARFDHGAAEDDAHVLVETAGRETGMGLRREMLLELWGDGQGCRDGEGGRRTAGLL